MSADRFSDCDIGLYLAGLCDSSFVTVGDYLSELCRRAGDFVRENASTGSPCLNFCLHWCPQTASCPLSSILKQIFSWSVQTKPKPALPKASLRQNNHDCSRIICSANLRLFSEDPGPNEHDGVSSLHPQIAHSEQEKPSSAR